VRTPAPWQFRHIPEAEQARQAHSRQSCLRTLRPLHQVQLFFPLQIVQRALPLHWGHFPPSLSQTAQSIIKRMTLRFPSGRTLCKNASRAETSAKDESTSFSLAFAATQSPSRKAFS
jgi:hypothetical protein